MNPATGRAWKGAFLLPGAQCGGEAGPPSDYTMAVYSYNGKLGWGGVGVEQGLGC